VLGCAYRELRPYQITYDIFRTFEEEQVWLVKKKG